MSASSSDRRFWGLLVLGLLALAPATLCLVVFADALMLAKRWEFAPFAWIVGICCLLAALYAALELLRVRAGRNPLLSGLLPHFVVATTFITAVSLIPGILRARKHASGTTMKADLRLIDAAHEQYAIEFSTPSKVPAPSELPKR